MKIYFSFKAIFLLLITLFSVAGHAGRFQLQNPLQNPLFLEASQLSEQLNMSSLDTAKKAGLSKRFDDIKGIQQELWVLSGRINSGECVLDCIPKYRKIFPGWESSLNSYISDARNSLVTANSQNPPPVTQQAEKVANKPVTCGNTAFKNLTPDQGKALKYLLEKKYDSPKVSCIGEIIGTDKFPLRGQTVVKYQVMLIFPNGYRTDCLERENWKNGEFHGFNAVFKELDCSDTGMSPAKVGETRTYSGEEII